MTDHRVYLSLGTNIGDRRKYLRQAIESLHKVGRVEVCSSVYETEPWGYLDQDKFLNMVTRLRTELDPLPLLKALKALERQIGREPGVRYGPRVIDMDILCFDDILLNSPDLTIPHPQMAGRAFVLVPLAELDEGLIIPGLNVTVSRLMQVIGSAGITKEGAL